MKELGTLGEQIKPNANIVIAIRRTLTFDRLLQITPLNKLAIKLQFLLNTHKVFMFSPQSLEGVKDDHLIRTYKDCPVAKGLNPWSSHSDV